MRISIKTLLTAIITTLILLLIYFLIWSNTRSKSNDIIESPNISIQSIKENYVAMAYEMYADSLSTAKELQSAVNTLITYPSLENLIKSREAYKKTRVPYQQSEIMRWDSDLVEGKNLDLDGGLVSVDDWEGQVNAWPLDEGLIDYVDGDLNINDFNAIASNIELTKESIIKLNGLNDNEANVATGIHAIEFLLWGQDLNGTNPGAGNRPYTDYDQNNCTHENCTRRAQYLKIVTDLLVEDLTNMLGEWDKKAQVTKGTLSNNFLNHPHAIQYILLAIKTMSSEELASARMASAFENNDTEEEHDCFSDLSHVAIYNNFAGIRNAFYGTYKDISGPSISDLIRSNDEKLYSSLSVSMTTIESQMKQLLDLGNRAKNPIRFDQLVGQKTGTQERRTAENVIENLINLGSRFDQVSDIFLNLETHIQ